MRYQNEDMVLQPHSTVFLVSYFLLDKKVKNLAPIEKKSAWKAIACFLCTLFFKSAGSKQCGPKEHSST